MMAAMPHALLQTATAFAQALDEENYDRATSLLAEDCKYHFRGKITTGRDEIIRSYQQAGEWAATSFENIRYESRVTTKDTHTARIRFADITAHNGLHHRHECEQLVHVNDANQITRIEHIDLPGERDRLLAFLAKCGIEYPNS